LIPFLSMFSSVCFLGLVEVEGSQGVGEGGLVAQTGWGLRMGLESLEGRI
jgi:hypothetical protein